MYIMRFFEFETLGKMMIYSQFHENILEVEIVSSEHLKHL